ncbi:3468_t:CDS:2 [Acaulospora morrowiae]|uniref:3468_t:CDS:1 n=1 Tax=Acaulospora morrowiae TaxID=94023 RepID=A0A9N9F6H6_9GLOM|nr:3468_t:CDS:2 [Acaulospora morrowiae]
MDPKIKFSTILFGSLESSAHVIGVIFIGYVGARIGLFNKSVRKFMKSLVFKILLPCLLFTQIGSGINLDTIKKTWPLPVFCIKFAVLSGLIGSFGGNLLRLSKLKKKFIFSAVIFNNITALPVGLIKALVNTGAMRVLAREDEDSSDVMSRGVTYLLLSTYFILLTKTLAEQFLPKDDQLDNSDNSANHSGEVSVVITNESDKTDTEITPLLSRMKKTGKFNRINKTLRKILRFISNVITPPIIAGTCALIVGMVPELKKVFFGDEALLYPYVTGYLKLIALMTVPMTLLSIGAQAGSISISCLEEINRDIVYIITCRYLIMPIVGIAIVLLTKGLITDDPMLVLVLMCLACWPTTIDLFSTKKEMAMLMFYSYVIMAPAISFTLIGLLSIVGYNVGKVATAL